MDIWDLVGSKHLAYIFECYWESTRRGEKCVPITGYLMGTWLLCQEYIHWVSEWVKKKTEKITCIYTYIYTHVCICVMCECIGSPEWDITSIKKHLWSKNKFEFRADAYFVKTVSIFIYIFSNLVTKKKLIII